MQKTLKEFYNTLNPNVQLGIYNSSNELIFTEANFQDCKEVIEKYADLTSYKVDDYGDIVDIVLNI